MRLSLVLPVLLALSGCFVEEPAREPARRAPRFEDPEARGSYVVGRRRESVVGRGRRFTADLYYPAQAERPAGRDEYSAIDGSTVADAPPLRGEAPFALAVFTHGLSGVREQNTFQVEYLVSHGWIVLTIDHEGSRLWDNPTDAEAAASAVVRPDEVSAAIDALQAWTTDPRHSLYGLAVTEKVAVIGHSFGGWTALAVGGAEAHLDDYRTYCAGRDDFKCDILASADFAHDVERKWDARVGAIVPLTPGATRVFGAAGIPKIAAPALIMAGSADDIASPQDETEWLPPLLDVPYVYLNFKGAGHLSFSQLCLVIDFSGNCGTHEVPARDILHRINVYTVAFLGYYMRGHAPYRSYLEQGYASGATWVAYQADLR